MDRAYPWGECNMFLSSSHAKPMVQPGRCGPLSGLGTWYPSLAQAYKGLADLDRCLEQTGFKEQLLETWHTKDLLQVLRQVKM